MKKLIFAALFIAAIGAYPNTATAGGYEYDYAHGHGAVVQPNGTIEFSFNARAVEEQDFRSANADGSIKIETATGSIMADVDCLNVEDYVTGSAPFGAAMAVITRRSGSTSDFPTNQVLIRFQDNDSGPSGMGPDTASIEPAAATDSSCVPLPGPFPLISGDIVAYDRDL